MITRPKRYKDMERYMSYALYIDTAIFILYLIVAGSGINWLKVIFVIFAFLISGLLLGYLYLSREIFKRRSLWISTGAAAILICLLFSLILNFPTPNKYKPQIDIGASAYHIVDSTT